MVASATDYLQTEQANAFRDPRYGFEVEHDARSDPETVAFIAALQAEAAYPDTLGEIPGAGFDLRQTLRYFETSIAHDVSQRLPSALRSRWKDIVVGILPTGRVNACVLSKTVLGVPLDRPLLLINYGTIFGCLELAEALTVEILTDDLAPYRRDGSRVFQYATERFLSDDAAKTMCRTTVGECPIDVRAQITVRAGALAAIMYQFVALHEFGHIVAGDVESASAVVRLSPLDPSQNPEYERPIAQARANWPSEVAADEFAVRYLCDWARGAETCWPNVAQVYLMFSWLAHVEDRLGQTLCMYHPPPSTRRSSILAEARRLSPRGPSEDFFAFVDDRIVAWSTGQDDRSGK